MVIRNKRGHQEVHINSVVNASFLNASERYRTVVGAECLGWGEGGGGEYSFRHILMLRRIGLIEDSSLYPNYTRTGFQVGLYIQ